MYVPTEAETQLMWTVTINAAVIIFCIIFGGFVLLQLIQALKESPDAPDAPKNPKEKTANDDAIYGTPGLDGFSDSTSHAHASSSDGGSSNAGD